MHPFARYQRLIKVNALAMVVAIGAIIWQIAAGVDYPTVPPGPIILGVAVVVVLFVRATWARIVGVVVPLFLLVGGTIASMAEDDSAPTTSRRRLPVRRDCRPACSGRHRAGCGHSGVSRSSSLNAAPPISGGGMTDSIPAAAPITDTASAPRSQNESPSVGDRLPQPASVLASGGTGFLLLEREAQVAALRALIGGARSGGGRFVVIEGGAGIGKTRLLAEGRAIAGSAGMRVLAARGGELEGEFGYGIVRQLFEPLLASASPDLRAELLSGPAALVEPLFGASQLATSQDAAGEGSFAILHGLYWLAANAALERPTLLAIDDLHWADTASLRWLLYLVRRLEGVPLLVAAGTRPPEGEGRNPPLVAELIADPEVTPIRPEPLGRGSIKVLARELHGLVPDDAFCAAVETATGGNPLFIGAVLDAVAREGTSPTAEHVPRLLEIGAQGVAAPSGFASPACRNRR